MRAAIAEQSGELASGLQRRQAVAEARALLELMQASRDTFYGDSGSGLLNMLLITAHAVSKVDKLPLWSRHLLSVFYCMAAGHSPCDVQSGQAAGRSAGGGRCRCAA